MTDKIGIQETEEAIEAIMDITIVIATLLKDGYQMSDITAFIAKLYGDKDLKDSIEKGFRGVSAIPKEMSDLDVSEMVRISTKVLAYIPNILSAIRK